MCTMIDDMMRAQFNLARAALGATLLSMALLASGCTKPVEKDDARMVATPEQERRAPTQPAVRPPETVAETKQKAPITASKKPVQETAVEETAVQEPAPAAPVHTASELMGKRQSEVTALMGTPARIEQRAASTVWVYQGGDCALDVFFFLDMATSDERVLTVAPSADSATAAAQKPTPPADESAATEAANAPQNADGTAIDACYGKLRRS
jgi:hypothetical protein